MFLKERNTFCESQLFSSISADAFLWGNMYGMFDV